MTTEKFIAIWNNALSMCEVRDRCGMTNSNAHHRANRLREKGFDLKVFEVEYDQPSSCPDYQPDGPASEPTTARPGTRDKVRVLRARVERCEHLWHAEDERMPITVVDRLKDRVGR